MIRPIFVAMGAAALSSCMTMAEPPRGDGWAAIGEATQFGRLSVTPLEIVEDSRCPEDVQCIWAGRVVVRTRIAAPDGPAQSVDLESGNAQRVSGGMLTLTETRPSPVHETEIAREDYRFRFTFAPDIMGAN